MLTYTMLGANVGMWAGVVLLALAAVMWAALLRWVRAPGWAVSGGLIAGLLLGPTVLGRALPATFEMLYEGGAAEQLTLQRAVHDNDRYAFALEAAGATPEALQAAMEREERELEPLRDAVKIAKARDQQPMLAFTIVAVAALMLTTGLVGVPRSEHKHSLASPLNIGGWSAVLPGALAALLLWGLMDESINVCLLAAASLMIGPWALTAIDRRAADDVEMGGAFMIQTAGRVASALAVIAWLAGLAGMGGFALLMMGTPIAAMAVGWIASPVRGHWLRRALEHSAVPIVVGCAAVRVDFLTDVAFWPVLMFLLLSGDGRWLGALIGSAALGGRRGVRAMRLVLGSMAAGPTQAAVAALGAQLGVLPNRLVAAALLGAALIEIATPARRSLARRLAKTEQELDEILNRP